VNNKSAALAVQVGIFVVVGTLVLLLFSLRTGSEFGKGDSYAVSAYFDDALGLADQADVSLAGVRIGEVEGVDFDVKRRLVKATLRIDSDYPLPADSVARIKQAALLGTSIVSVEYGSSGERVADGGEIPTEKTPGLDELIASVSEASEGAKKLVESFEEGQKGLFGKVEAVIDENREDIRSFAQSGPKLEKLADNLNEITDNMKAGKGTMGRLYADEELYTDLKSFTSEAKQIAADVRETTGTLHRLIYDDSLATEAEESFRKMGEAGDEVKAVLGDNREQIAQTIDSLKDVGPRIEEALTNFQAISRKINDGEGTLGKLVNDPTLYDDAKRTLNQVGQSFEAGEEQGVIRSFIGVVFGALI